MMSTPLIASHPAPLLNTPEFSKVFGKEKLSFDEKGHIRALELIALPGDKLFFVKQISETICEVMHPHYPITPLYVDMRMTSRGDPSTKKLPTAKEIEERLRSMLGLPYVWGGNWSQGLPHLNDLYPETPTTLTGVDCSGLLYEATMGVTPRNTHEILTFGRKVDSLSHVKPLDILVWPGHMMVALSHNQWIESLEKVGVQLTSPPISQNYLIRRFI